MELDIQKQALKNEQVLRLHAKYTAHLLQDLLIPLFCHATFLCQDQTQPDILLQMAPRAAT